MANIPIRDIASTGIPSGSSFMVYDDGTSMKRTTVEGIADAVRPVASEAEAAAGADNSKVSTPLRVKQYVDGQVGVTIASKTQGDLANTAVQSVGGENGVIIDATTPTAPIAKLSPDTQASLIPSGGIAGQTLVKLTNADHDLRWENPPGGGDMLTSMYDPASTYGNAFDGFPVGSVSAVEALDVTKFSAATLIEPGREGMLFYSSGDHSADVTADSAQGSYIAPSSDPTGASGAWLRIRPNGNLHKLSEYGDDLSAALAVAAINGGTVEANTRGTIIPAAGLLIPSNVELVGFGREQTFLDFASVSALVGPNSNYAIYKSGGGLTALPSFTSISAGDRFIVFSAAHGLKRGDIICIYNSANGSFLPATSGVGGRDYYRSGQRLRVIDIDGNTVYVDQAVVFSFTSGGTVTIYKQNSTYGRLSGMSMLMEGNAVSGNRCVKIMYGDRVRVEDVGCYGAAYEGMALYQCYQADVSGVFATDTQSPQSNSYPLSFVNCAHTNAHDFSATGKWNGVGFGGDDGIGCIQNFGNKLTDFTSIGVNAPGVDLHGNVQNTTITRGSIRNGASFAGLNTQYRDCDVVDDLYPYVLNFAEVGGGRQSFIGGSITCLNANGSGRASIDGYGGGAFRSAFAETIFELKTTIFAPNSNFLIGIRNDSAARKFSHDIDVVLQNVGTLAGSDDFLQIYQDSATPGAGTFGRVRVQGLPVGVAYGEFQSNYSCAQYDYPEQNGTQTITTSAANVVVGAQFSFDHGYPVAPVIAPGNGVVPTTAEAYTTMQYQDVSKTTARLAIWRLGGTNFTAGATTKVNWRVKL